MLKRMKTKVALVVMAAVLAMALAAVGVAMADNHMGPGEEPSNTPETQQTQETQQSTESETEGTPEAEEEVKSEEDETYREKVIAKAAEILGVTPEELKSALEQAHDEVKDEQIEARIALALAKLVEKGHITQQQADELMAWIKSRPEWLDNPVHFWKEIHGEDDGKNRLHNVNVQITKTRQVIKQRNGEVIEQVNEVREDVKDSQDEIREELKERQEEFKERMDEFKEKMKELAEDADEDEA
jgi:hypothetical protein